MAQIKPNFQLAVKRVKNFQEIALGFPKKSMVDEAIRYSQCIDLDCDHGCPLGVDIPSFIRMVREGDSVGALAKIREENDLPAICGRVCLAPCERASCAQAADQAGVSIRALERYASDHGRARFAAKNVGIRTGKKVAVIGSGPAGLTAASRLAKAGLKVTVHEILPLLGGTLRYGLPEFRLPKNVLDAEIEEIRCLGVEFKTNFSVGQSMKVDQFLREGYSAVLLTVGKNSLGLLDIPGADLGGVYYSQEILLSANTYFEDQFKKNPLPRIGDKVVVIGSENAALDCSRVCLRLGREVTLVFPGTPEDLKIYPDDLEHAKEEGLKIEALTKPLNILADAKNFAAGVQCVRMDFADAGESGKWELKPVPASEHLIEAQTIILASGFKTNSAPLTLGTQLQLNDNGSIKIHPETSLTSIPHLYAAGDAVQGASSLVEVMASGKRAAAAIVKSLKS